MAFIGFFIFIFGPCAGVEGSSQLIQDNKRALRPLECKGWPRATHPKCRVGRAVWTIWHSVISAMETYRPLHAAEEAYKKKKQANV